MGSVAQVRWLTGNWSLKGIRRQMSGGITYFLTINAGSSSIKCCLFDSETLEQKYTGTVAGIGLSNTTFSVASDGRESVAQDMTAADHPAALRIVLRWLKETVPDAQLLAVAHRIVHGGPRYHASCMVTAKVMQGLRHLTPLDPEHLPIGLDIIERLGRALPGVPHIACFDTAFFHELPTEARLLPIPRRYEAEGVRRYGFHGLSYAYLLREFERVAGHEAAHGKIVFAHLGNGASLAAVKNGKSIDTSMGLTPAGGIPMSSRSGDLDPGILTCLAVEKHLTPEQLSHMVGFESGLLGISETSADMKQLLALELKDSRAKDAVDIFCYSVRKYIGAYAAALGGLNSLVFSGGIGEASAPVRARICKGLDFLGITVDPKRNKANAERISAEGSGAGVHVLPTNEALTMARDARKIVKGGRP
jgi:acetate kinase